MENHTEYIDDYFAGNLNPEERKNFEKQMELDKNFAAEVAFYVAAKQALKEELAVEKKEWFRELASQHVTLSEKTRSAPVRRIWVYRLAAAAVFVGIVFFSWNLFFQPSTTSPNELANKYISTNLENLGVTMGVLDSMQEALQFYNAKQYTAALQYFEQIIQRDTSNYKAKTNAGLSSLMLGNYDKALSYFQQLATYTTNWSNPAIFYQALTLMKRNRPGDKEEAKRLLKEVVDNHLDNEEEARHWLNKKW
jgi:tetratricopeptide (TPR) repeat protein